MANYTDLVGRTVGVVIDADTAMADWVPPTDGRLIEITVVVGGIAATTLIENGYIRLACQSFGGVDMYAPFDGAGVFTAPGRMSQIHKTQCDLKVVAGKNVRVFYYHNVLPTTPEITVFGKVEG